LFLPLPSFLPLLSNHPTHNRHFDRSCSQSHREQRSGEICFSTPTRPHAVDALPPRSSK
jgi:hypothetical protein